MTYEFKTILIALDGSEHSDEAIPLLRWLLGTPGRFKVHLLRVVEPFKPDSAEREELEGQRAPHLEQQVQAARDHLEELCAKVAHTASEVTAAVLMGPPVSRILAEAEHIGADLVAMVTKGRSGPVRWIKGSVTEEVMRQTKVPLLVYNPSAAPELEPDVPFGGRILFPVGTDGLARAGVEPTAALARAVNGSVTIYTCRPILLPPILPHGPLLTPPRLADDTDEALAALEPWREAFALQGVPATVQVGRGDPVTGILRAAKEADLIALTTHGHGGLDRFVLGSITEGVLRRAKQPLLIVRAASKPDAAKAASALEASA